VYESTYVALENLYPQLVPGGYLLIDDYGAVSSCRQAVQTSVNITLGEEMQSVDWSGVSWCKSGE
jgi:hypothetical protein